MYRILGMLVVVAVLAACGQGGGATTDASAVSSPATSPSGSAMATDDMGGTGTASPECSDSFSGIEEMEVTSITELGDLPEEVQPTIENCESLDEWVAAAEQALGDEVNPSTASLLLGLNCGDPSVANTPLCRELASN